MYTTMETGHLATVPPPVAYKRDEDKSVSRLPTDGKFGIRDRS